MDSEAEALGEAEGVEPSAPDAVALRCPLALRVREVVGVADWLREAVAQLLRHCVLVLERLPLSQALGLPLTDALPLALPLALAHSDALALRHCEGLAVACPPARPCPPRSRPP